MSAETRPRSDILMKLARCALSLRLVVAIATRWQSYGSRSI